MLKLDDENILSNIHVSSGCAQTAAVGYPMEGSVLLFLCALGFNGSLIQARWAFLCVS